MIRIAPRTAVPGDPIRFFVGDQHLSSKTQILVGPDDDRAHPNGFLVEQQPRQRLDVHFHGYAQFQLVVAGEGSMGPHALQPVTVHYAGQRTPYGPILPGDAGLSYLTLRPHYEAGAFFMPASRDLRDPAIPRREEFGASATAAQPAGAGSIAVAVPACETLIAPGADGLAAWVLRLPAGARMRAPEAAPGDGRYHVVTGGSWLCEGKALDWLGMAWSDGDDAPLEIAAGPRGCELVVMQFPRGACAHPLPAGNAVFSLPAGSRAESTAARAS